MPRRFNIVIVISLVLFLLDRALKFWARFGIANNLSDQIISLTYIKNDLGPFGFPIANWLITIIGILVFIFVVSLARSAIRNNEWLKFLGFSLVIIGGFSNLLDRIILGGVIDIFITKWNGTFNLADAYLFFGLLLVISQSKINIKT